MFLSLLLIYSLVYLWIYWAVTSSLELFHTISTYDGKNWDKTARWLLNEGFNAAFIFWIDQFKRYRKIRIIRSARGWFDFLVTEHCWSSEKSNKFYRVGDHVSIPDHPCAFLFSLGDEGDQDIDQSVMELLLYSCMYCLRNIWQPKFIRDCPSCGLGTLYPVCYSRFSLVWCKTALFIHSLPSAVLLRPGFVKDNWIRAGCR